jgi:hypothetical protein
MQGAIDLLLTMTVAVLLPDAVAIDTWSVQARGVSGRLLHLLFDCTALRCDLPKTR